MLVLATKLGPFTSGPNPSLNTDVPHVWADARRSGPPVSLFR